MSNSNENSSKSSAVAEQAGSQKRYPPASHYDFDFDYDPWKVDLSDTPMDEFYAVLTQPITSKELEDPAFEERKEKDPRYRRLVEEGIKRGWQQATSMVAERHFRKLEKLARKAAFACDDLEKLKKLIVDITFLERGEIDKAEEALLALNPGKFTKEDPGPDTEHSWEDLYRGFVDNLPEEGSERAIIHEGVLRGWQQAAQRIVSERFPIFTNLGRATLPDVFEPHRLERLVHILSYM